MKSWSDWFRRRVEQRRRAARMPKFNVVVHGYPETGPIFPGSPPCGPLAPPQIDFIRRIEAERAIRHERRRVR